MIAHKTFYDYRYTKSKYMVGHDILSLHTIIAKNDTQEGEERHSGSALQEKNPPLQTESVVFVLHKQMVRNCD